MKSVSDLSDEELQRLARQLVDEATTRSIPIKGTAPIYPKKITSGIVSALIKVRQAVGEKNMNDVHKTKDMKLDTSESSNFSTLRQAGLIARVVDDNDKAIRGRWLITNRGGAFLRGDLAIPIRVHTMNNHPIKIQPKEELVKITDITDQPRFDDYWDHRAAADMSLVAGHQTTLI